MFTIERILQAPVATVWKAITDVNEMKQWYFDFAEFKAEPGFKFEFSGGTPEKQYLHLCEVKEVVVNRRLSYSWRYDGYEGNSLVTFELFEEGNATRVKLTHEGLESFPKSDPNFSKESFAAGWTEIIGTLLKNHVEKSNR